MKTLPEQHESGKGTIYGYGCLACLVKVTTSEGRVTKAAEALPDGVYSITEYKYDRNGNITEVTLPEGGRADKLCL